MNIKNWSREVLQTRLCKHSVNLCILRCCMQPLLKPTVFNHFVNPAFTCVHFISPLHYTHLKWTLQPSGCDCSPCQGHSQWSTWCLFGSGSRVSLSWLLRLRLVSSEQQRGEAGQQPTERIKWVHSTTTKSGSLAFWLAQWNREMRELSLSKLRGTGNFGSFPPHPSHLPQLSLSHIQTP